MADSAFGGEFGFFEVAEDDFGAFEDGFGDAREARDLDSIAFVGTAFDDLAQEDDLVVPLADSDVEVPDAGKPAGEFGEFVVMGGEKSFGPALVVEVFHDGPGEAETVEGAGAAANFVEDDEALRRGVVED